MVGVEDDDGAVEQAVGFELAEDLADLMVHLFDVRIEAAHVAADAPRFQHWESQP